MNYPAHKVLSAYELADLIRESKQHGQRFCFILGSGASVESGIRSGGSLEMSWMNYLMGEGKTPDPRRAARTRQKAASMKAGKLLKHEFGELEHAWKTAKEKGQSTLPSEYYFDLYRLRFYPHKANGYRYMEEVMERAKPSIGYHTLSLLLTETDLNNLLITTNFDSLVEDALAIYTDKKPLVVAHESLAGYIELDTKRPIIAKIHRGLFFEPLNDAEETNELREEWREAFSRVFERYAPIVIGYGGGDGSLMRFLEEPGTQMRHGLYWCVRAGKEPEPRIRQLVEDKDGCFVEIKGFDGLMLALGYALYGDAVIPTKTDELLKAQYEKRMERYWEQFNKLKEDDALAEVAEPLKQEERQAAEEREASGSMTAQDYYNRAIDEEDAGDTEAAFRDYTAAIKLKPDYAFAYNNRGIIYANQGDYQQALEDFNHAIELKPDHAKVYNNRGKLYQDQRAYQKALEDYNRAIELKPDYATAYNNRGRLSFHQGDSPKALEDFNRAIELKPDFAEAYNSRGILYYNQGDYQKALEDYNRAIELKPDNALAYNNRAILYRKLGQDALAEADEAKARS